MGGARACTFPVRFPVHTSIFLYNEVHSVKVHGAITTSFIENPSQAVFPLETLGMIAGSLD